MLRRLQPLAVQTRSRVRSTTVGQMVRYTTATDSELQGLNAGGCGSMYAIDIASKAFEGTSIVKQHRMVNEVLKEEIKGMHGLQLKTSK
ncbi:hypothetical protein EC973_005519 [Apophysomyces ossiformis]|uniref:Bola-like protein n=1 Tax=Apophysomyces ossiformis TaxID=679940 RepID=A0A8H7BJ78_9FUNG|nr:hypothetical protein EC973_005519 [Apophysomyces ossiformis]